MDGMEDITPALAADRVDYARGQLLEGEAPADPYLLFDRWLAEAVVEIVDGKGAGGSPDAQEPDGQ